MQYRPQMFFVLSTHNVPTDTPWCQNKNLRQLKYGLDTMADQVKNDILWGVEKSCYKSA